MCKHCSRLVEDSDYAPVVHQFFEVLTEKANRKLRERGFINTVTADEIDIEVKFTGQPPPNYEIEDAADRIRRLLSELDK